MYSRMTGQQPLHPSEAHSWRSKSCEYNHGTLLNHSSRTLCVPAICTQRVIPYCFLHSRTSRSSLVRTLPGRTCHHKDGIDGAHGKSSMRKNLLGSADRVLAVPCLKWFQTGPNGVYRFPHRVSHFALIGIR